MLKSSSRTLVPVFNAFHMLFENSKLAKGPVFPNLGRQKTYLVPSPSIRPTWCTPDGSLLQSHSPPKKTASPARRSAYGTFLCVWRDQQSADIAYGRTTHGDLLILQHGFGGAVHGVSDAQPFIEQIPPRHLAHSPAHETGAVVTRRRTASWAGAGSAAPDI